MKKTAIATALLIATILSGCNSDADVASQNLSTAADNFQINRRIVFYNCECPLELRRNLSRSSRPLGGDGPRLSPNG